ncbi:MAG: peptide chain release factor N(5)-glutamine methyltransferase [Alphaproteobacteria bacterium]
MPTIHDLLTDAVTRLGDSDSPRLDAELLLARLLGRDRSWLHAWPETEIDSDQQRAFTALLARRAAGEPVAHLLGERGFWTLQLKVTPDTLIPRPETELLVEQALARLPTDTRARIADLGTGSGAIALALATERPACTVVATDRSDAALAVARDNAARLGLHNVEFRQGDWLAALAHDAPFDLIVSNPPYIKETDPHLTRGDVRFEPRSALAAGPEGLDDITRIIEDALPRLEPGGWLLLEHGYDQADSVTRLLRDAGYAVVEDYCDLAGQPRVAAGRKDRA